MNQGFAGQRLSALAARYLHDLQRARRHAARAARAQAVSRPAFAGHGWHGAPSTEPRGKPRRVVRVKRRRRGVARSRPG